MKKNINKTKSNIDNLLIIRSAPLDQLKNHFNNISAFFKTNNISILTQTITRDYINSTFSFKKVFYTSKGKFNSFLEWNLLVKMISSRFDVILIPFANLNGNGYANVIWLAILFYPKAIWSLNKEGHFERVERLRFIKDQTIGLTRWLYYFLFLVWTVIKIKCRQQCHSSNSG